MAIAYISLLLITLLVGFKIGEMYILKGLSLRINQLYEEGDSQKAKFIEEVLKETNAQLDKSEGG